MTHRRPLNVLTIPEPCTVPWRSMSGTDQVRFCSLCQQSVYNLSAMTEAQAEAVLRIGDGSPCVRFRRRSDGTVVTADRCGGRVARAWGRVTAMLSAAAVAFASLTGCDCARLGFCDQGKPASPRGYAPPPPPEDVEGEEVEEVEEP